MSIIVGVIIAVIILLLIVLYNAISKIGRAHV